MSSKQVCPTVPPLYTWDSGTRGIERDSQRDKLGTTSIKSLALAVLSVPLERDKRDKARDKGENLVPRCKEAVGQKIAGDFLPKEEKLSLEKYDPSPVPVTRCRNRTEAFWYATCPDYWRGCTTCPDGDMYHYDDAGKPVALKARFCKRHDPPPWSREATHGGLLQ